MGDDNKYGFKLDKKVKKAARENSSLLQRNQFSNAVCVFFCLFAFLIIKAQTNLSVHHIYFASLYFFLPSFSVIVGQQRAALLCSQVLEVFLLPFH